MERSPTGYVHTRVRTRGYKLQTATKAFVCDSDGEAINAGEEYVRVIRMDHKIEVFHEECFRDEFGVPAGVPLVS